MPDDRLFKRDDLQELARLDSGADHNGLEVIENTLVEASRWSLMYELTFKREERFFSTHYSCGATEYQDESPFEYESEQIECTEVFPVEKTITVYESR